jgi:hypothetical protein
MGSQTFSLAQTHIWLYPFEVKPEFKFSQPGEIKLELIFFSSEI